MAGLMRCLLLLVLSAAAAVVTAMPPNDQPEKRMEIMTSAAGREAPQETFSGGFSKDFAHNLPTQEFMGDFARRSKRQVGVSSTIEGILSSPYGGLHATNHLQALLSRNTNIRPARQSAGASRPRQPQSSPSFSSPSFSPSFAASDPPRSQSQSSFATSDPPRSQSQSSFATSGPLRPQSQSSFASSGPPRPQSQSSFAKSGPPRPQSQSSFASSGPPRPQSQSSFAKSGPPRSQSQFDHPQQETVSSSLSPERPHPLNRAPNFQVIHEHPSPSSSSAQSSSISTSSSQFASSPKAAPSSHHFSPPSVVRSTQQFSPSVVRSTQQFPPSVVRSQQQFSPSSAARSPPQFSSPVVRSPPQFSPPSFSPPQKSPPSARNNPVPPQDPFSSTSFTGQQFGPSFSDIDSFFESARIPRERRDVTARQDASSQRDQIKSSSCEDAEAAKEDSEGFIVGKPDNFPGFHTIGGFGPMADVEKGDVAGNFMEEFKFPAVQIPDINEEQPQFSPEQFQKQAVLSETQRRPNLARVSDEVQTRVRRRAGEPDPSDQSNVPHKRVHRVQVEPQIPHSRNPRQFEVESDSQGDHSELPVYFESLRFPNFRREETSQAARSPARLQNARYLPIQYSSDFKVEEDKVEVHTPEDDIIIPDGQSFYPSFNGHPLPVLPPLHPAFFPSAPVPARAPGARGGRFLPRGPGYRENQREQASLRDLRNSFHGSGMREGLRKPFHREQEHENLDNSLLGSGNFEILRGGTFYDDDDPNGFQPEYDHLLDDAYLAFPGPHNAPHTNNYVDDFFSNFRDFSEFAVRKGNAGEQPFLDDGTFYGSGFASEQVHQVVASPKSDNSSVTSENKNETDANVKTNDKTKAQQMPENSNREVSKTSSEADDSEHKHHYRQPKNIQDVLEDVDPQPSKYESSSLTVDEKDPMLAMF
nr:altered inheritance of mitochondria protein 21-like [Procambarus clarkii]